MSTSNFFLLTLATDSLLLKVTGCSLAILMFFGFVVSLIDRSQKKRHLRKIFEHQSEPSHMKWEPPGRHRPHISPPSKIDLRPLEEAQRNWLARQKVPDAATPAPSKTTSDSNTVLDGPSNDAPTHSQKPTGQILYLDPDFDISEIKRIFRIWALLPQGEIETEGCWKGEDGTSVYLYPPQKEGFPFLEFHGPMSNDLVQFLPEDLPVHPVLPSSKPN